MNSTSLCIPSLSSTACAEYRALILSGQGAAAVMLLGQHTNWSLSARYAHVRVDRAKVG